MVTSAGALYVYHFDGSGHTVALSNASQQAVNYYTYSPYGRLLAQQEAIAQPFKYAGQVGIMAEGNDLYYMRARYYDAAVGRFLSEDPAGFVDGSNLYAYVGGNPIMAVDPSGLEAQGWGSISDQMAAGHIVVGMVPPLNPATVYRAVGAAGEALYVGITNNLERRAAEQLASKGISIDAIPGLSNIARSEARAVEQVLIENHGLPSSGGTLMNKINSISSANPIYNAAKQQGAELLKQIGYPGF